MREIFFVKTVGELAALAEREIANLKPPFVFALKGELGSGKTTFTQALAKALGITEVVNSPTFNILKVYEAPQRRVRLYHIDCYRLKTADELRDLGFGEWIDDPEGLVVIEWAEKVEELMTVSTRVREFEFRMSEADEGAREIVIGRKETSSRPLLALEPPAR